ncbi:MAG TPA: polysaccharide biosynthesis tyrosine autokinase [Blastocatellia bacterium]|nr:polysaccharide biosynthesis tyrosine autokinase [Blastocatellia bacterium]
MSDENVELERITPREQTLTRPGYPRLAGYTEGGGGYGYGYGYGERPTDGPINFRELWRRVRKRKWLIAVLAVIVTSIVTVDIFRTKSTYVASATIEVGKENQPLVQGATVIIQGNDSDSMKTTMLSIKSRPLLEEVAANLHLDQNPKFFDVTSRKSVWEAVMTIAGKLKPVGPSVPQPDAAQQITDSKELTEAQRAKLSPYVGVLSGYVSVDQIPDTRALIISFTHTEPAVARDVANGVAETFISRSFETKTEKFTKTSEWLDTTTRKLQAKVEEAEKQLADYTREHNIFSDPKETFSSDKLSRLQDQVGRAETDRILKQSLYEQVQKGQVGHLPESFDDPRASALQTKLQELETQAAELDVKYGPENPRVREVQGQITAIKKQIADSRSTLELKLRADYERAVREEQSLKAALERAKTEAVSQNQANIQYNIYKQNVDTSKALYVEFLQKTSQAEIQKAEQHNSNRIMEPASLPGAPVGPRRLRTILMALFLSLVGGVGLAFFLEYLDNTVKTVEDVSRYAQLPALSVIPAIEGASGKRLSSRHQKRIGTSSGNRNLPVPTGSAQIVALESRSSAAEAYRVLRTSVLLSTAGRPPKTILVTSGQPSEGKTTTVINTAISLAQLGASVLVIDCDLRKPSAHKIFGVDPFQGLSTYLSRDVDLEHLIHKLQIANLSLLPCGPIPPNPAELISSERMRTLLQSLTERYDHILIDSPPLINVTDPVILSTMVDGVILVVHGGKSTRDVLRRARQELTTVGAKIFGVVLNNVDLKREGYDDYYYYRYYSGYGDGKQNAN